MCMSPEVSFAAAAVLLPAGAVSIRRAWRTDRRYLALAALPLLFGLQQAAEGLEWQAESGPLLVAYSLAYMFFTWLAWPVWVPVATYFLEPPRRQPLYVVFAVAGGMLGAIQYLPYFAHDGWLVPRFLSAAISYEGTYILDFLVPRPLTYAVYLTIIVVPLLIASDRGVAVFGVLVALVAATTYLFFRYAYVSVFCFGGAMMSLYLVHLIFHRPGHGNPGMRPLGRAATPHPAGRQ